MMAMKGSDDQNKIDLLVFGYACKLFRDDEKAQLIDGGSHLIPWMGDETLKIDRYDGRGALYDLSSHEPKADYNYELSDEDDAIEQLCDKERYRSIYINEEQEAFYAEEIAKRTQQKEQEYSEVAYNYDVPNYSADDAAQEDFAPCKPFVPAPELKVPTDMKIPETVKHNAILERTALFLAQQGSQMEILMKVKQQGNKNFDFLSHNDHLHEYYKHLKALIKSGSYVPQEQYFDEEGELIGKDEDHYLHPSLVTKLSNTNTPSPPLVQEETKVKPPPPENTTPPDYVIKIMDKMIKYVISNGNRFEAAVMKRGDVRFSFLNPRNPYHGFYKNELSKKQASIAAAKTSKPVTIVDVPKVEPQKTEESVDDTKSLKRKPLPVSFSIKKPKESEGLEVASALPLEESSEDEEESNNPSSPKQQKLEADVVDVVNTLEKRIKKSSEVTRKHKQKRKDVHLQNERKLKVAQFLKDLKKKAP